MCGDNGLRHVAGGEIGTKPDAALVPIIGNLQTQRAAGVIMPDLHRVDAMPVRAFAARQQEIDRGGERAAVGIEAAVAKRFAIVATFGMRLQFQPRDDVGGGG
jgi:hypothetical protein